MFCTQCGTKLEDRDRFCAECGAATGAGMQQAPGTVYNRLSRPLSDRKLAGVCSALARYFGVDPVLIRVLAIALAIWPTGVGVIMYIACWIVMPNDTVPVSAAAQPAPTT